MKKILLLAVMIFIKQIYSDESCQHFKSEIEDYKHRIDILKKNKNQSLLIKETIAGYEVQIRGFKNFAKNWAEDFKKKVPSIQTEINKKQHEYEQTTGISNLVKRLKLKSEISDLKSQLPQWKLRSEECFKISK